MLVSMERLCGPTLTTGGTKAKAVGRFCECEVDLRHHVNIPLLSISNKQSILSAT